MTIAQMIMQYMAEEGFASYLDIQETVELNVRRDVPDFELTRIINSLVKLNLLDVHPQGFNLATIPDSELEQFNNFNVTISAGGDR